MREDRKMTWNGDTADRPRVLIECPPDASPGIIADVVERNGFAVRTCSRAADRRCDLLDCGHCTLVTGADVVVNLLGQHRERGRRIAEAVRDERRPPALVVEVPAAVGVELDGEPGEPIRLPRPLRTAALLDAIRSALATRDLPAPRWEC
jgi:hypothetical protein